MASVLVAMFDLMLDLVLHRVHAVTHGSSPSLECSPPRPLRSSAQGHIQHLIVVRMTAARSRPPWPPGHRLAPSTDRHLWADSGVLEATLWTELLASKRLTCNSLAHATNCQPRPRQAAKRSARLRDLGQPGFLHDLFGEGQINV